MAAFGVATLSGLIAVDGEQKNLRFHRLPRVSRAMMLSRLLCLRHFSSLGLPRLRPRSPNRTEFLTYSFRRDGRAWTLSGGRCRDAYSRPELRGTIDFEFCHDREAV